MRLYFVSIANEIRATFDINIELSESMQGKEGKYIHVIKRGCLGNKYLCKKKVYFDKDRGFYILHNNYMIFESDLS